MDLIEVQEEDMAVQVEDIEEVHVVDREAQEGQEVQVDTEEEVTHLEAQAEDKAVLKADLRNTEEEKATEVISAVKEVQALEGNYSFFFSFKSLTTFLKAFIWFSVSSFPHLVTFTFMSLRKGFSL